MRIRYGSPGYEWPTTIENVILYPADSTMIFAKYCLVCRDDNGEEEYLSLPDISEIDYDEDGFIHFTKYTRYGEKFYVSIIVDDVDEFLFLLERATVDPDSPERPVGEDAVAIAYRAVALEVADTGATEPSSVLDYIVYANHNMPKYFVDEALRIDRSAWEEAIKIHWDRRSI
jgi:hypothetical protein